MCVFKAPKPKPPVATVAAAPPPPPPQLVERPALAERARSREGEFAEARRRGRRALRLARSASPLIGAPSRTGAQLS